MSISLHNITRVLTLHSVRTRHLRHIVRAAARGTGSDRSTHRTAQKVGAQTRCKSSISNQSQLLCRGN